jgi:hypothetical protein
MRFYFLRNNHIVSVESIKGSTDEEAIDKAFQLFSQGRVEADGFELWDRARILTRWREPEDSVSFPQKPSTKLGEAAQPS